MLCEPCSRADPYPVVRFHRVVAFRFLAWLTTGTLNLMQILSFAPSREVRFGSIASLAAHLVLVRSAPNSCRVRVGHEPSPGSRPGSCIREHRAERCSLVQREEWDISAASLRCRLRLRCQQTRASD